MCQHCRYLLGASAALWRLSRGHDLAKGTTITVQRGYLAREPLPAFHRHINVGRIEFDPKANPPGGFRRDQGGARPGERLIDRLAGAGIVQHRAAHALDRLLGAMPGFGVPIPAGNMPERGLFAVASPVALALLAHSIPAGFMLPVIIAPAQQKPFLGPDDLRPDGKGANPRTCRFAPAGRVSGVADLGSQGMRWPCRAR